jgi:GT2 family glycosyltransferase
MSELPELSVIVVNWNSAGFVRKCLASIRRQKHDLSIEIIVIDNCSKDGCGAMIAAEFPDVRFIQADANIGFANANNLAFEQSHGELLLFLNPDTEVGELAIERMVNATTQIPDAGLVGPLLLNSDLSVQTSCIQRFPTIWKILLDSDALRNLLPKWSLWGTRPLFDSPCARIAVEAVSGACQMMRRDVFQRAGLYNSAYFMYVEDVDLCRRVRELGLKTYHVGDAVVVHHGGQSSGGDAETGRIAVMMREAWRRYFELYRGRRYAMCFKVAIALQAVCRLMLIAALSLIPTTGERRRKLNVANNKWTSVLRWAVGREAWASEIGPQEACIHAS